jgi:Holliday junction resolvase RusA-like endonuclease
VAGEKDAVGRNVLAFTVYGVPIQKGSARAFMPKGAKYPVVTSDTRRGLKEWERSIRDAAQTHAGVLLVDAVRVSVWFVLPRPVSLPKKVRYHTKKPDIDKLARAVLDALTGVLWKDDSQVVQLTAWKSYQIDATDTPSAVIAISPAA